MRLVSPPPEAEFRSDDADVAALPSPASSLTSSLASSPTPAGRARVRALIVALLAAQALIPLTYYLRDDPYDERFAWRMFSGVRLQSCEASVFEQTDAGERELPLYQHLQAGWVESLRRNRGRVVERFLALRCEQPGVHALRFVNHCQEVDGTARPPIEQTLTCAGEGAAP